MPLLLFVHLRLIVQFAPTKSGCSCSYLAARVAATRTAALRAPDDTRAVRSKRKVTARADTWSLIRLLLVQLAPKENGRSSGYTWPLIQPLHSLMSPRWMRLPYRLLLVLIASKEICFSCSYLAARAAAALKLRFVQPKALVQLSLKKATTRSATDRASSCSFQSPHPYRALRFQSQARLFKISSERSFWIFLL
jgi:hypothetical protein